MAKQKNTETPLMQQHRAIKQKYPDAILLFRVGDFYETFGQDAIEASKILGITLTKRNNGAAASSELAGFPHHSLDTYLHKLVKAGHRVAVCDQLEDPKQAKGIVKRGVTDMVSPGTTVNDKLLEQKSNNFLAAIHWNREEKYGLCFLDVSTGELLVAEGNREYADKLLQSFQPAEIVFQRQYQQSYKEQFGLSVYTYTLDEWIFDAAYATELLQKHFQVQSFKGFGVDEMTMGLTAAGAIFHYLKETDHAQLQHVTALQRIDRHDFLWMDRFTIRNLELIHPTQEGNPTLLSVIDNTITPMGARLLKRWMIFPLTVPAAIHARLDTVEFLVSNPDIRSSLKQELQGLGDMERLTAKIPFRKINPREVRQLAVGLRKAALLKSICEATQPLLLKNAAAGISPCQELIQPIENTLIESPPAQAQKGELIAKGVHIELDELRQLAHSGKEYLTGIQQRELVRTGIQSLKIGFNNVFGYYLEVTNAHKEKVPSDWIRKQTLTNAERYITPELKEYEEKIMGAEERILKIELELYEQLIASLQPYLQTLQTNAKNLSLIDCLCCFAENAILHNYCKPVLLEGDTWDVIQGRHPVIERSLPPGETYIGNDLWLDAHTQQVIILTGPNMSGKSALLRQTALITLLAHMGHYVPATKASIPLTDKIFTRVGASDNLSGGESTFMVEMNETASILNNLSNKSLVLLDEIGRGTSTYDGISIAWSIAEFLHEAPGRPRTLFATHYHELNELETQLPRVKNYHITHRELGNKIIFLRKLAPGGTTHSFGIHVARMAGMPNSLLKRAEELLIQLEAGRENQGLGEGAPSPKTATEGVPQLQLSIFDAHSDTFREIRLLLESTNIDQLTPVEALLKLQEIKNKLQ
jgi:DNA mismatch repair protein MutS